MNKIHSLAASLSKHAPIIALMAAGVLSQTPAFAQFNSGSAETRALAYYAIPLDVSRATTHAKPYLGFSVTHGYRALVTEYGLADQYRLSLTDVRFDPVKHSITRLNIGGIDFASHQRLSAADGSDGATNTEWTPGMVLAGIAIAGGVLALVAHEAASIQPPGCNIANVIVCKNP